MDYLPGKGERRSATVLLSGAKGLHHVPASFTFFFPMSHFARLRHHYSGGRNERPHWEHGNERSRTGHTDSCGRGKPVRPNRHPLQRVRVGGVLRFSHPASQSLSTLPVPGSGPVAANRCQATQYRSRLSSPSRQPLCPSSPIHSSRSQCLPSAADQNR